MPFIKETKKGVLLRLDGFLYYKWRGKTYKNDWPSKTEICWEFWGIYRGYYTVARRYEVYVRVRYCSCHENIKLISSSQLVMFFLLYGETNSTKAKVRNRDVIEPYDTHEGNIRKIRHSGPWWSGVWNLRVVYFLVKHSPPYNNKVYFWGSREHAIEFLGTWEQS